MEGRQKVPSIQTLNFTLFAGTKTSLLKGTERRALSCYKLLNNENNKHFFRVSIKPITVKLSQPVRLCGELHEMKILLGYCWNRIRNQRGIYIYIAKMINPSDKPTALNSGGHHALSSN